MRVAGIEIQQTTQSMQMPDVSRPLSLGELEQVAEKPAVDICSQGANFLKAHRRIVAFLIIAPYKYSYLLTHVNCSAVLEPSTRSEYNRGRR